MANVAKQDKQAAVTVAVTLADAQSAATALDGALKRLGEHMLTIARYAASTSKTSKNGKPVSAARLSVLLDSTSTATSSSALGRYFVAEQAHTALTSGKGEGDSPNLMTAIVTALGQSKKHKRPTGEELSVLVAKALVVDKSAAVAWRLVYNQWVKANEKGLEEAAAANKAARESSKEDKDEDENETTAPSLGKGNTSGHGDPGIMTIAEAISTAGRLIESLTARITPAEASLYEANVLHLSVLMDDLAAVVLGS